MSTAVGSSSAESPASGAPAMVEAENVHKSFGHVEVLKGIDLELDGG